MDQEKIDNGDQWTIIQKKTVKYKQTNIKQDKPLSEIQETVIQILQDYNPYAIYLYGSRTKKTNKIDSDIDLMVFWKKNIPNINFLYDIKNELINTLNLNVDFVNMIIKNKIITTTEKNMCFYDNVISEAIKIYGDDKINISDLIDTSIKLHKI